MADDAGLNPVPEQLPASVATLAQALRERASATLLGADILVCDICGSIVADVVKHAMWHESLASHLHWTPPGWPTKETITTHEHDPAVQGDPVVPSSARTIHVVTDIHQPYATLPSQPSNGRL